MTLIELRQMVKDQNLDGQTILAGYRQWTEWMTSMPISERFASPEGAELGFPLVYSSLERPRVHVVLHPDVHPDESRVVENWPE